ncbi:PQQ-binding-like beta-propeller repeat protein [Alloacidobacterium sp.]|uniref:outer membrane protein assembly factor BamB family protein n=1 Tax=Alloacidobacterium sp. TaxID=2951999 RepID=UPI002D53B0CF|nr:PQQ-binding-like beta-propeller repeat protein [Alloacidobacterium sp.]HYK36731.1 PQQ-binding-like beta-propeller repeat protein [Alloacidobacterium sp.]
MKSPICVPLNQHPASLRVPALMLAIAPLWLMLFTTSKSAPAQTSNPSPADWTQFHRDNMQRWNPYETALGVNNVSTLELKWSFDIGNGPFVAISSSPAVVNGVAYIGSGNGNVYALNATTGAKLWSFTTGGEVISSPAVTNGVVYFGSLDNNLYALNASTGTKLWSFATGGEVISSPTVANGVVYIGPDSGDGKLYALNATTGAELWSSATGGDLFSSPAVANGVVYVGSNDGNVYALNANTGAELWSFTTGASIGSSPAVANGVVYVGSDNNIVYALNASTGAKLWSFEGVAGSSIDSSPAVANGVVYVGSIDSNLYALNASTGTKLWSFTTDISVRSSPAVANGVVYVGSFDQLSDGTVYALNASTGAKLWSDNIGSAVLSSPAVVDGVVYVDTFAGKLYAFAPGPPEADLFLRIFPTPTTVHQGDLLTYAFPVWNFGLNNAVHEVLNTQVPEGTTFDYIRISGTPGLGTCTTPPYQGTGQIVCHENASMAPNTTWTVRLTVKVTAPAGTVITENAATMSDTFDPNLANNTATVSLTVQ